MNASAAPTTNPQTATPVTTGPSNPAPSNPAPAKTAPQGNPFGTDAVYKGYDLMVRKCATHIIREPKVTASSRADLVRAISSPAVTFAASAADGSILVSCPDGLPELLTAIAEPMETAAGPAETERLAKKLDLLDGKLDTILQDRQMSERISDRLEALEYTLRDRLDSAVEAEAARTRLIEKQMADLGGRLDTLLQAVTQMPEPAKLDTILQAIAQIPEPARFDTMPLELSLAATEQRLLAALHIPQPEPDLSPVLTAVAAANDKIAALPDPTDHLTRLDARLDTLSANMDQAVARLPVPQDLTDQHNALLTNLAALPAEVERRVTEHLDFTPLVEQLHNLHHAIAQTAQSEAVTHLTDQVQSLTDRPQPELDLTAQNQTLADLALQIEALIQITREGPDLSAVTHQQAQVLAVLGQPAQQDAIVATLAELGGQITALAARPEPVLDLTEQNNSLHEIASSLAALHDKVLAELGLTARTDDLNAQLSQLADQIGALAARPDPVLDLSDQNRGLGDIAITLTEMAGRFDVLTQIATDGPDLSALTAQYDRVLTELGQTAQSAQVEAGLMLLSDQLNTLAARPDPVLDLSAQNRGLGDIATTLTDMAGRFEILTQITTDGPDLSALTAQYDSVMAALDKTAQAGVMQSQLAQLADRLTAIATRPDPVLDLSEQNIALGHIGKSLSELAHRFEIITQITAEGPDLSGLTAQYNTLMSALGNPAQSEDVSAHIADLSQTLRQLAARPDPKLDLSGTERELADIGTALTGIAGQISLVNQGMATAAGTETQFDAVLMTLGQTAQGSAMAEALAVLAGQLSDMQARPQPRLDLTEQNQILADLAAPLAEISLRLDGLTETLRQEPDHAVLTTGIDMVLSAIGQPAQDTMLARAATQLAQIAQRLDSLGDTITIGPDLTPVLAQIDRGLARLGQPAQHPAMAEALSELTEQIATVAQRPDPVIDTTAQRQSLSRFGTAIGNAVERLETVADLLSKGGDMTPVLSALDAMRSGMPGPDAGLEQAISEMSRQIGLLTQDRPRDTTSPDDITEALAGLSAQIDHLAQNLPQLAPNIDDVSARLADLAAGMHSLLVQASRNPDVSALIQGLEHSLIAAIAANRPETVADHLTSLSDQLHALASRPDPVLDLTEHQQDFARFAAYLSDAVQRLETITDRTASTQQTQILSRIDGLWADISGQLPDTGLLADITAQIGTLLQRPDLSVEIAEQKQCLGDFAKALAELVQWLEPLTQDLAAGTDFSPVLNSLDQMRSELNTQIRDEARDLAVGQSFTQLSDQIADLAKSPDGLISLAEQRRSFASFSNALSYMLQRIDGLTAAQGATLVIEDDQTSQDDTTDRLAEQLARLPHPNASVGTPLSDLANTLSTLILRLEFLVQSLASPSVPDAAMTAAPAEAPPVANMPEAEADLGSPAQPDPAQLIQDLATATTALGQIVQVLEGGEHLQNPVSATVAELFDRLDAALDAYDQSQEPFDPALADATDRLDRVLHGVRGGSDTLTYAGNEAEYLQRLRLDFAELVARALRIQSEAA